MKYKLYPYAKPEEIVYTNGSIIVYYSERLSRYYLTRDGIELGFKNPCYVDDDDTTKEPDYDKWYASWEQRVRKRYAKIESLVDELQHEKAELFDMISNQEK